MLFVLPQAFVCISSSKESKACSSDAWNRNPHERQRDVDSKRLAQHCILRPVLGTEAQLLQDDLLFMDVQIVGASRSTMDGFFTSRAQNTTSVLLIWPSLQKLAPRSWTGRPDYREAQVQLSSLSSSCSELQENQEIDSASSQSYGLLSCTRECATATLALAPQVEPWRNTDRSLWVTISRFYKRPTLAPRGA